MRLQISKLLLKILEINFSNRKKLSFDYILKFKCRLVVFFFHEKISFISDFVDSNANPFPKK